MWIEEKENGLLIHVSENFKYHPNIAIFSFYKTLINTNLDLYSNNVINTLNEIDSCGSIVIIDNFKESICNIKKNINKFLLDIDNRIPFIIICSFHKNRFMKPFTNIFDKLKYLYDKEICVGKSIVVGSNAGRKATNKLFKDDSDADRAFANNLGMQFFTPEQLFDKDQTVRTWQWQYYPIENILNIQKNMTEPTFESFLEDNCIIMISGPPCSGKSLLANRIKYFYSAQPPIIDINNFENRLIMRDYIQNYACDSNITIIVDIMENDDIRESYFTLFEDKHIILIEINTYRKVCEFLNKFKLQITKSPKVEEYSSFVFNKYYKSYKPFSLSNKNIKKNIEKNIENIKYIEFPLILRTRKEIFYHF